jgi:hypothetical protein
VKTVSLILLTSGKPHTSKALNKAATTVKVAVQTGAAKDDFFSGFTEETANQILNLLGNDPGAAR